MAWTDRLPHNRRHWAPGHSRSSVAAVALLLLLLWLPQARPVTAQEYLSVYGPRATFSVPLQQYGGRDYVAVLDILAPLGEVAARQDGHKWKLRFNSVEVEFQEGKNAVKLANRRLELASPFHLQDGRGLVPLSSLIALLSPLLPPPVELHETARRLFLGGAAVHFSAEVVHSPSDSVVLTFSAPVNPSIATEPGRLSMTFVREPLLHPSPSTMNFEDQYISSLSYREAEGVAELTLNSNVPLLARFSSDRKTITVGPVVQIVAQAKPQPVAPASTPASPPAPSSAPVPIPTPNIGAAASGQLAFPPPIPLAAPAPPPLVVVDASHGGTEPGAALSDTLAEKDVVLSIAQRLHNDLEARGLHTMLLRNSDTALSLDQRAILANTSRARFYISVHAGSLGSGVRLYTALLPPISPASGTFLPWDSAQASYLSSSQTLSGDIATELGKLNVSSRQMQAPLPPLNHISAAAVAVEVVPPGADVTQLNSAAYQEQIAGAIAAGVARAQQGATP
jgi:N-acetylmuramoyl-L-alanine amidase